MKKRGPENHKNWIGLKLIKNMKKWLVLIENHARSAYIEKNTFSGPLNYNRQKDVFWLKMSSINPKTSTFFKLFVNFFHSDNFSNYHGLRLIGPLPPKWTQHARKHCPRSSSAQTTSKKVYWIGLIKKSKKRQKGPFFAIESESPAIVPPFFWRF